MRSSVPQRGRLDAVQGSDAARILDTAVRPLMTRQIAHKGTYRFLRCAAPLGISPRGTVSQQGNSGQ
jgi:hypothetical protein